jgi:hypothetical protein
MVHPSITWRGRSSMLHHIVARSAGTRLASLPLALLFLSVVVPAGGIAAAGHFDGLYGQDPYAYLDYATGPLAETLRHLQPPPPFYWPPGYPLLVTLASAIVGSGALAGQIVSLVAGGAVAVFTALLAGDVWHAGTEGPFERSSTDSFSRWERVRVRAFPPHWLRQRYRILPMTKSEAARLSRESPGSADPWPARVGPRARPEANAPGAGLRPDGFADRIESPALPGGKSPADNLEVDLPRIDDAIVVSLVAGLVTALNGQLWQSSIVIMSDTTGLALATIGVWSLVRYRRRNRARWLVLASATLAWAVLTRWAYALVAIPCAIYAATALARGDRRRTIRHAVLASIVAGAILAPVLVPALTGLQSAGSGIAPFATDLQVYSWSPLNAVRREFITADGLLAYPWPNGLFYALAPGRPFFVTP